jgi:beta-glucosidase/6-phospho-beta-glucosidase/beta-galactosidase
MRWFEDGTLHFGVGIEDTFIPQTRAGERPIDEYQLTEHYRFWHSDLALAAQAGASYVRWGVPWYGLSPERGTWDWAWLDRVMSRFAELGLRPIVDLMHYGTPLWLEREFAHPDYPKLVAEYSVRVAERYADTVADYTPVNEPIIHALFSGAYGYWPPYLTGGRGFTTMVSAIAEGVVLAQQGMAEVLGDRATFVHVDAGMRFTGDVDGEHRESVERLRHKALLVEDLVTGSVGPQHPLAAWLVEHGMTDDTLRRFADDPVRPDVMGVNYYPRHSTEVFEEGVRHDGGFADPRPTTDDGETGLAELLTTYEARYGAPVALTETCVTGTVAERLDWLDRSVECVRGLRAAGHRVVGFTWWPLFDMYEWTYRHRDGPRSDSLLTMGLWDLVESPDGLLRRRNAVADRYRMHATLAVRRPPT